MSFLKSHIIFLTFSVGSEFPHLWCGIAWWNSASDILGILEDIITSLLVSAWSLWQASSQISLGYFDCGWAKNVRNKATQGRTGLFNLTIWVLSVWVESHSSRNMRWLVPLSLQSESTDWWILVFSSPFSFLISLGPQPME